MNEKINQMAEKYPEEYREQITEILRLRNETNEIKIAHGKNAESLEDYEARMLAQYVEPSTQDARIRAVNRDLETAQRVNAKTRQMYA